MNKLQVQIQGLEVLIENDHRGVRTKIVTPGFDIFNESITQFASFGCKTVQELYENLVKETQCTSGFITLRLVPPSEEIFNEFSKNSQETFVEATMMTVPQAQYLTKSVYKELIQIAHENNLNRSSSPKYWLFRPKSIDNAPNLSDKKEYTEVMLLEKHLNERIANEMSITDTIFQEQLNQYGLDTIENYTYKCLWLYNWEAYQLLEWYFNVIKEQEITPVLFGISDFHIHSVEDEKRYLQTLNQKLEALDNERNTIINHNSSNHSSFLSKQFQFEKSLENLGFFDGLFLEEKLMRLSNWGCKYLYVYLKAVNDLQKQLKITVPSQKGLEVFQKEGLFPDVLRSKTMLSHKVPKSILKTTLDISKIRESGFLVYYITLEEFFEDKFLIRWEQGAYKKWMKSEIHKINESNFRTHLSELIQLDRRIREVFKMYLNEGEQNILKSLEKRLQLTSIIAAMTWLTTNESLITLRKFGLLYLTSYLEGWLLLEKTYKLNEEDTKRMKGKRFVITKDWFVFNKRVKNEVFFQWLESIEYAVENWKTKPNKEKYYLKALKQDLVIYGKWIDDKFHVGYIQII